MFSTDKAARALMYGSCSSIKSRSSLTLFERAVETQAVHHEKRKLSATSWAIEEELQELRGRERPQRLAS